MMISGNSTLRVSILFSSSSSSSISSGNSPPSGRRMSIPPPMYQIGGVPENIHPAISELALLYSNHRIIGGNSRSLSLLRAFKKFIQDYYPPHGVSIARHLDSVMKPQIAWLVKSRPLSISMAHSIRHLKWQIAHLPQIDNSDSNEALAAIKNYLYQAIDSYIKERIELADELIITHGMTRIEGETLLVYSYSDVILSMIIKAAKNRINFSLVVADSDPLYEGQSTIKKLQESIGPELTDLVPISYVPLAAIGHVLQSRSVSRVFLGAQSIYSNGNVQTRAGSSLIAMMAHRVNVPVIICCETYKFSDKVLLESTLTSNTDDRFTKKSPHPNLRITKSLHDIIPAKFISMIITEIGMIPWTSVPVVLREYRPFPI